MADRDQQIDLDAAEPVEAPVAHSSPPNPKSQGRWRRIVIMAIVPLLVIGGALYYWRSLQGMV